MSKSTAHLYVLGHNDEVLSPVPMFPNVTAVDLRKLSIEERWNTNQFAESRFLLSDDCLAISNNYVAVLSASHDKKWKNQPSMSELSSLTTESRLLKPTRVFGALLSQQSWIEDADNWHPGMREIIEQIIEKQNLSLVNFRVPYANTFICEKSLVVELALFQRQILNDVIETYGEDIPFQYRCPTCETTSHEGIGRYRRDRHIGFLAERITMLFFAQQPGLAFYPFQALRPKDFRRIVLRKLIKRVLS